MITKLTITSERIHNAFQNCLGETMKMSLNTENYGTPRY